MTAPTLDRPPPRVDVGALLRRVPAFADLPDEELAGVARELETVTNGLCSRAPIAASESRN